MDWSVTEGKFADLVDWLADRIGQRVVIEACPNEGSGHDPVPIFPLSIHATLGQGEFNEVVGAGLTVPLLFGDDGKDRLWLDPERITRIQFYSTVARIWFGDDFIIMLAGSAKTP